MWPVEGSPGAPPGGWSKLDRRARLGIALGGCGLVLAIVAGTVLSIHAGSPQASAGTAAGPAAARLWISGRPGFRMIGEAGRGPAGDHADMAFDRARGALVVWEHGCGRLVMGFTGGCGEEVDRTLTWDGAAWSTRSPRTEPVEAGGAGAMVYDAPHGGVVYVNGAGRLWNWTGSDWRALELPSPGGTSGDATIAAGFDEELGQVVLARADSTWMLAGRTWRRAGAGIDPADARTEGGQLVDDAGRGQLVYAGRRFTWTLEQGAWRRHDEPRFDSAAAAFDPSSGGVRLISEDVQACDRVSCRSTVWTWNGTAWRMDSEPGPDFPASRSEAFRPAIAYDAARGRLAILL